MTTKLKAKAGHDYVMVVTVMDSEEPPSQFAKQMLHNSYTVYITGCLYTLSGFESRFNISVHMHMQYIDQK